MVNDSHFKTGIYTCSGNILLKYLRIFRKNNPQNIPRRMPSKLTNTLLDTIGIVRALSYRTFIERNWSKPQPMFNILQVKEGDEALFESFLKKSLAVSIKYDTPLSLGPFKTNDRTFIYITHYASSKAYAKVMNGLLFGGEAAMRAKATLKTSWTYCEPNQTKILQETKTILMVGIQGNPENFMGHLKNTNIQPLGMVKKIKDVRGHALGAYVFFEEGPEISKYIKERKEYGDDICTYKATKLD